MNKNAFREYVLKTPHNTNPNVVVSMVDDYVNQITSVMKVNSTKIEDYLYKLDYDRWDYEDGEAHLQKYYPGGACSAIRKGKLVGRNYDWTYDEAVDFVIHTKCEGRHESIGMANALMPKDKVSTKEWDELYKALPFMTLDGINDAGVYAETNVVPMGDKGYTFGTNPLAKQTICSIALVRFILDFADSARHGVELLNNINIYGPLKMGEDIHLMIADKDSTYEVEFVNNKINVISDQEDDEFEHFANGKAIVTNFHLSGFDGNTTTGFEVEGGINPEDTTLTPFAMGVERYDILVDEYDNITSTEAMFNTLDKIKYTNAYNEELEKFWYSEEVGTTDIFGTLTIYDNKEKFEGIKQKMIELYQDRQRDGKTWQTVHSSVVHIVNKTLKVKVQEGTKIYTFNLE